MTQHVNLFWFRRDLRLTDNAGLYHALKDKNPVVPIFIFDKAILDELEDKHDRRVAFIYAALQDMQQALLASGSTLEVHYGYPAEVFRLLLTKYKVDKVFTNHDYEYYARRRDKEIDALLKETGVRFQTYKDGVIFEKEEVVKDNGKPYSVFTPYSRRWHAKLNAFYVKAYPVSRYAGNFFSVPPAPIPSLQSMGFSQTDMSFPVKELPEELVARYDRDRDYPALGGTSRLGLHLRFGTISVRDIARRAKEINRVFLNELVWRDFYQMILWNYPQVGEGHAFKPAYDTIRWRNNEQEFALWCEGKTGYPIVDAGMRELNETGFMHNRVRMITASFLCKHLLIDWRWGEAYFAGKLLDYDFASNNGGWQWASGSGCDAAPFFRIFNPALQTKKFDKAAQYIRRWVPEWGATAYPAPIVVHEVARERCLQVYRAALRKQSV